MLNYGKQQQIVAVGLKPKGPLGLDEPLVLRLYRIERKEKGRKKTLNPILIGGYESIPIKRSFGSSQFALYRTGLKKHPIILVAILNEQSRRLYLIDAVTGNVIRSSAGETYVKPGGKILRWDVGGSEGQFFISVQDETHSQRDPLVVTLPGRAIW